MAGRVLIQVIASARASWTANAIPEISVTMGESLTIRGFPQTSRTFFTSAWSPSGSLPNSMPPFFTLGHETFISRADMPSKSRAWAARTYSCSVEYEKVHDCMGIIPHQKREFLLNKDGDTNIFKSYGIDHATGCLYDPRCRIAVLWGKGKPLGDNAAQQTKIKKLRELLP